jgi:hypothetical protein
LKIYGGYTRSEQKHETGGATSKPTQYFLPKRIEKTQEINQKINKSTDKKTQGHSFFIQSLRSTENMVRFEKVLAKNIPGAIPEGTQCIRVIMDRMTFTLLASFKKQVHVGRSIRSVNELR